MTFRTSMMESDIRPPLEAAEARPCGGALRIGWLAWGLVVADLVDDDAIAGGERPLRHLGEGAVRQAGDDRNALGSIVAQHPDACFGVAFVSSARSIVPVTVRGSLDAAGREAEPLQRHAHDVVALVRDDAGVSRH